MKNSLTVWHLFIPVVVLLSAATTDRAIHWLWALGFFALSLALLTGYRRMVSDKSTITTLATKLIYPSNVNHSHALFMALFVLYLGSWVPDVDWLFQSHRNPLTHSALPLLVMARIVQGFKVGNLEWNRILLAVFAFGLGSHLWTDLPTGGNVVWLPAEIDYPFLFVNGVICLWYGYRLAKQRVSAPEQVVGP